MPQQAPVSFCICPLDEEDPQRILGPRGWQSHKMRILGPRVTTWRRATCFSRTAYCLDFMSKTTKFLGSFGSVADVTLPSTSISKLYLRSVHLSSLVSYFIWNLHPLSSERLQKSPNLSPSSVPAGYALSPSSYVETYSPV